MMTTTREKINAQRAKAHAELMERRFEVESVRGIRIGNAVELTVDLGQTFDNPPVGTKAKVLGLVKGGNGTLIITDHARDGVVGFTTHHKFWRKVR